MPIKHAIIIILLAFGTNSIKGMLCFKWYDIYIILLPRAKDMAHATTTPIPSKNAPIMNPKVVFSNAITMWLIKFHRSSPIPKFKKYAGTFKVLKNQATASNFPKITKIFSSYPIHNSVKIGVLTIIKE